nr:hypothetical protein GCM10020092_101910 [Actinoplanes digitatis]
MKRSTMLVASSTRLSGTAEQVGAARALRDQPEQRRGGARQVGAGLRVVDVDDRAEAPLRCHGGDGGLYVGADVARAHGQGDGLLGQQRGAEVPVHEQAPDVGIGHPADELLDVDTAIAQGATVTIGLRDLCGERNDAEPGQGERSAW